MPARYAYSLRDRLPWVLMFLQTIFTFIFLFLFSHKYKTERPLHWYPGFQDVNVMVILGVGFLFAFLKKFAFSGIGFNFMITAVGLQWAIILDAFLVNNSAAAPVIGMTSLRTGLMSVFPVLISSGVILGKVNPVQLIIMTLIELPIFTANRYIMKHHLMMSDHVIMMYAPVFGAYFGLALSWSKMQPLFGNIASEQYEKSQTASDLFSMLGTVFLWLFWPSFNSLLLEDHTQLKNAVFNTYLTLATCTLAVFSTSALLSQKGKFKMSQIHNGVLAGGVAIGFSAHMVYLPWIAMTLGLVVGIISTIGLKYMQDTLRVVTLMHDTRGIHYTFGLPGVIGALVYSLLILIADHGRFGLLTNQALVGIGCIFLTLTLSLVGGLLTGFLLTCKLLKPPKEWHFFHDQPYWERKHLSPVTPVFEYDAGDGLDWSDYPPLEDGELFENSDLSDDQQFVDVDYERGSGGSLDTPNVLTQLFEVLAISTPECTSPQQGEFYEESQPHGEDKRIDQMASHGFANVGAAIRPVCASSLLAVAARKKFQDRRQLVPVQVVNFTELTELPPSCQGEENSLKWPS
ncbi:RH-like protein [Gastrophryne carolinensis]